MKSLSKLIKTQTHTQISCDMLPVYCLRKDKPMSRSYQFFPCIFEHTTDNLSKGNFTASNFRTHSFKDEKKQQI